MFRCAYLAAGLVLLGLAFGPVGLQAAETLTGSWSIGPSNRPGLVEFQVNRGHSTTQSRWKIADLVGLDPPPARHDVQFTVERDAGRLEADGVVADNLGAGTFHFIPDSRYASEMARLGLGRIDEESQFADALHDVSLTFAREMVAAGIAGLDAGELLAFRIHGVDNSYVQGPRQAGKIHGATAQWASGLAKLGYTRASADQLIAFRVHGVTPEFIDALRPLGLAMRTPEQPVAMRIHGVTPEYIAGLETRGMKNLTVDQLVALRIHGID
jgi:hypothetical protein